MAKNKFFKFKQFTITQEKSAMKVGTDGILLGAWANPDNCRQILDVGTGTGLVALMLAQRSDAQITAVEIEEFAALEAKQNVFNSPWKNQLVVHNNSFQDFAENCSTKFDLIVSNPPFFNESIKAATEIRTIARHTDSLSFTELLAGVAKLLNAEGKFSLILPFVSAMCFEELALNEGLFLIRKTEIKPSIQKLSNRVLMEFGKTKAKPKTDCLAIYAESGTEYTESFKNLTKEFYLNF